MPVPLLFLSDAISCSSGLGRITRDLASRVHEHLGDLYRVGTVGYGACGSRKYPWPDYRLSSVKDWLVPELPEVWDDFAGNEEGILFSIWDASRLYWLGMPQACHIPQLRKWVETARIKKWIYGAIDAEGPNGKVSHRIAETYKGFDRVLDYSAFSSRITGNPDHLPHGIDTTVFYPRDHKQARKQLIDSGFLGLKPDSLLIGIVATNQTRKNWQLGVETCKILLDRGHDLRLWMHTDMISRYWDLGNLIADYGLVGRAAVTTQKFSDDQLAWMYSACDVTLGIAPEGFGYPIAESLACGVPCLAGSYGAQDEFGGMPINPVAYYYEGAFCSKRPVHDPNTWADAVVEWIGQRYDYSVLPKEYDWNGPTLWQAWESWFRRGL